MGLIDSILGFFVNRDVDKLQNSQEWKDLIHKINASSQEMDNYNEALFKSFLSSLIIIKSVVLIMCNSPSIPILSKRS